MIRDDLTRRSPRLAAALRCAPLGLLVACGGPTGRTSETSTAPSPPVVADELPIAEAVTPRLVRRDSGTTADIEALWLAPDATLWLAARSSAGGSLVRSLRTTVANADWEDRSAGLGARGLLVEFFGTGSGRLFGCGRGAVWSWTDDHSWRPVVDFGDTAPFRIAGSKDGRLVALCSYYPRLYRLSEESLSAAADSAKRPTPQELEEGPTHLALDDVWVFGANDVVLINHRLRGPHARFMGGDWSDPDRWISLPVEGDTTSPTDRLHDLWSPAEGELVAVGSRGQVLRLAEGAFRVESVGVDVELLSVWGDRSDRIVAVGRGGVVVRFDGDGWSVLSAPTDQDLLSVRGRAGGRVFVGGAGGVLFELSG